MTPQSQQPPPPLPPLDLESAPFLEAASQGRFVLQRCTDCGTFRFPPRLRCPHCLSLQAEWLPSPGRGEIYSFVVVHQRTGTALDSKLPYASALVRLAEGPLMLAKVVDTPSERLRIGMPVRVVFEEVEGGIRIPRVTAEGEGDRG